MNHLIDILQLSPEEIMELVNTACDIIDHPAAYAHKCDGKILATLFFEPSTRTRLSFESAMLSLGGQVLGFSSANSSSASKGESVADTIRVVSAYCDIIAMRHPKEGAPLVATQHSLVPVINAGDGGHNHPTQTLTDLITIHKEKGHFDNLTIGFCGDLKFGRTVHSLVAAMSRYTGVRFVFVSPEELKLPRYVKEQYVKSKNIPYTQSTCLEEVMPELDILYMTRVQKERFFNEEDYLRLKDSYILTPEKLENAKEDADLSEIRTELAESGFIRRQAQKKGQPKPKRAKPLRYISSDGYEILVGKSNLQNDELTLRTAEPTDLWMHTKDIPGSHVIIRTNGQSELPEATMEEAANLAAFYSKAKNSSMVPVDYTQRKNIKKPNGAKPGMVIYLTNKTIYITPDEARIQQMKNE